MPAKKAKTSKPAAKKASSAKKRTASTKSKSTKSTQATKSTKATKATKSTKSTKVGDAEVTIDRRNNPDRRNDSEAEAPKFERREKVQRRRQIDPTTCERDYNVYEIEFMSAMDDYKRSSGRMFPTCSEVLEVIGSLGYVKLTPAELAVVRPEPVESTESHNDDTHGLNEEGSDGEDELSEEFAPLAASEIC